MKLFKKKPEENISGFTCALFNNEINDDEICVNEKIESIKVLGAGCASCEKQYDYVMEVVQKLKLDIPVEYISDYEEILKYNVMSVPSLVINEKVVAEGKLVKQKTLEKLLARKE